MDNTKGPTVTPPEGLNLEWLEKLRDNPAQAVRWPDSLQERQRGR